STMVVFTSDHGDMTGTHGGLIDKGLLYEEAIRVPLLFRHETIGAGPRGTLATNMDIMPTVLSQLGIAHEPRHGLDLSPALADASASVRSRLLVEFHGLRFLYSQRGLIDESGLKLIFSPGDYDELYDLAADPNELKNLIDDQSAGPRAAFMRAALIEETARTRDPLRDCVAKFNGHWRTGSDQFDATAAYLKP
ncbi:MAG: sulfatase/phosphatase domain-containing protein, partial [Pseudomonadota bacterium]